MGLKPKIVCLLCFTQVVSATLGCVTHRKADSAEEAALVASGSALVARENVRRKHLGLREIDQDWACIYAESPDQSRHHMIRSKYTRATRWGIEWKEVARNSNSHMPIFETDCYYSGREFDEEDGLVGKERVYVQYDYAADKLICDYVSPNSKLSFAGTDAARKGASGIARLVKLMRSGA